MKLPKFTMEFEPTTVEHLGAKLYNVLPPVVGELVSNSWDADAQRVEITLPEGPLRLESEVIVRDNGCGMDARDIQEAYLRIGLNRREITGRDTTPRGRPLMGRKGLGKLSAFGVADELEVRTVRDGHAICITLDYEQMRSWPKGTPYEPRVVGERTGPTSEKNHTEVVIRRVRRTRPIEPDYIRRQLARRFTVIGQRLAMQGDRFAVHVNGQAIRPQDRRSKAECKKVWDVAELPHGNTVDQSSGWEVSGWIGIVEKSSQTERGVDIFARGKAVELETMFDLKTTHIQFARAYVVGEIQADFLDSDEDYISTARNSARWDSDAGQKLQEWGRTALTYVFEQWLQRQRKEKESKVLETSDFASWLDTRTSREQKIARKMVNIIVFDKNIEPESAEPLLQIVKTNIEFQAFQELVDEVEESGANAETLLRLFNDWRVVEAREHLRLSDGRLEVMENLSLLIKEGALEVKQIQPLFEENGWLVNPTWGNVTGQTRYTDLLREHCREPKEPDEKDGRIDILGYAVGGEVHVVELKRPEKTLSRDDLEQIERYVDWARSNMMGSGPDSPRYISGLLIVGKLSSKKEIQEKLKRLAGSDIRVETFDDLLQRADNIYREVEKRLKEVAPEYSREARRRRQKGV